MWFFLIILIGVIALTAWLSSPRFKGKLGEFAVSLQAKKYLNEAYILLNDCTLPDEKTGTTQIDHILLSPYGIFVIETKNYQGWIFGGERQKSWTQKLYKKSFKFQNPLHQNYKHIKVLELILADVIEPHYIHIRWWSLHRRARLKQLCRPMLCRVKPGLTMFNSFRSLFLLL